MFHFSKKAKPLSEYPDEWSVAEGMYENAPIVVRIRSSLRAAAGHPEYPFQIGVAVPFTEPQDNGLPSPRESKILENIEDALVQAFGEDAVLVVVITTGAMREFVCYAKEWQPEQFEKIVDKVSISFTSHDLQFIMQHDPKWDTFKNFLHESEKVHI